MSGIRIESPDGLSRVYLRPVHEPDGDAFVALMRDSQQLHHPWIHPPVNRQQFQAYLRRVARDDHSGFVIMNHDNSIVGVINVNNIVRGSFLSASLGYYAGQPYVGQGYMFEGLTLLLRHAFSHMGLHRLEANIQPENRASIALVERCGFHNEGMSPAFLYIDGQWRDHERWCILDPRVNLRS